MMMMMIILTSAVLLLLLSLQVHSDGQVWVCGRRGLTLTHELKHKS